MIRFLIIFCLTLFAGCSILNTNDTTEPSKDLGFLPSDYIGSNEPNLASFTHPRIYIIKKDTINLNK